MDSGWVAEWLVHMAQCGLMILAVYLLIDIQRKLNEKQDKGKEE